METDDVQLAAKALQELRTSSSSPPPYDVSESPTPAAVKAPLAGPTVNSTGPPGGFSDKAGVPVALAPVAPVAPLESPSSQTLAGSAGQLASATGSFLSKVYESGKSYSSTFKYQAERFEGSLGIDGSTSANAANIATSSASPDSSPGPSSPASSSATAAGGAAFGATSGSSSSGGRYGFRPIKPKPTSSNYAYGVYHRRNKSDGLGPQQAPTDHIEKKKKRRPVWQDLLVSATSLASISKESRMRLRCCLHLLKLANARLANTVSRLQELIHREKAAAMAHSIAQNHTGDKSQADENGYGESREDTVTYLKQDLISTIRKVVTVVSTFAGNSLPEPARSHVKDYILQLPVNWALSVTPPAEEEEAAAAADAPTSATAGTGNGNAIDPEATGSSTAVPTAAPGTATFGRSRTSSFSSVSAMSEASSDASTLAHAKEVDAGGRVLSLAKEALDMLGNIISVVDDTLERAEIWCQKVGMAPTTDEDVQLGNTDDYPPAYEHTGTATPPADNKIQIDDE